MIIEGILTSRAPISHISESISTGSLLNERELMQENGELVPVFCYNANAFRGQLRDNAALYLIEKTGIKELTQDKHNFLFSGGKIGGAYKFNLANIRNHFEVLPHFAVFGGCLDNMMLPSKLSVFDVLPICQEAMVELPEKMHRMAVERTYRRMTIEREFTRFDDSKNYKLNQTLKMQDDEEKEQSAMRMNSELLNSGVELFVRFLLRDCNDIEKGAFFSSLKKFAEFPLIGGQHNKGHGKVDLSLDGLIKIEDFNCTLTDEFARCLSLYDKHIEENKEEIIRLLS